MLLIIGATGNIGGAIAKLCDAQGMDHRVGLRRPGHAERDFGPHAEVVSFDFEHPSTFYPALRGASSVFFIAPLAEPGIPVRLFLDACGEAGVRYLLYSSGRTTGDVAGKPLRLAEEQVQSQPIAYNIIRPGWFMQNFFGWLSTGIRTDRCLYLPAGMSKTAFIDVRDIAEVALTLLRKQGAAPEVLGLTSEEALDHREVTDLLSEYSGVQVTYVPLSSSDFVQKMVSLGWTAQKAKYVAALYDFVRSGKEEDISPHVRQILGKAPRSFRQFLADHPDDLAQLLPR